MENKNGYCLLESPFSWSKYLISKNAPENEGGVK